MQATKGGLRARLFMGVAFGGALLAGYGRPAQAGSCSLTLGIYICSGPANSGSDATQALGGTPLQVETTAGFGIAPAAGDAFFLTSTGGLTFTDNYQSAITGKSTGVRTRNYSSGDVTLTLSGTVQGSQAGLYIRDEGSGALAITTASVTSAQRGIWAINDSGGDLSIDSTLGTVTGTAIFGIYANDYGVGGVTVTTAAVTSDTTGIQARSRDGGDLTIDSTLGTVTGGSVGIRAEDSGTGSISITTASVTGGEVGISASNSAGGDLTIDTTAGTVTGTNANGISASNSGGGNLKVTTASVSARLHGISVSTSGSGSLTIDSTAGTVTGNTIAYGVLALDDSTGGVTITTATVSGGTGGIFARNLQGGDLSIDSTLGAVTTTGSWGINADDRGTGDLTVTTASVSGSQQGIRARNLGGGKLIIDSTLGTVTGTSQSGLLAFDAGAGDLSVTTAGVTGRQLGIDVRNEGGGALTINSVLGTVTGTNAQGVFAYDTGAGDLTVTTAAVSGRTVGLYARNNGGGALKIDSAKGTVTGATIGLSAFDSGAGGLSITTSAVSAASEGISASNKGGGDLTVDTTLGTVTSTAGVGITALDEGAGDVEVTTAAVTGHLRGITAVKTGSGALSVDTAAGTVTGTTTEGMAVRNEGSGAVTVTTAAVTGQTSGITAINLAGGNLGIDSTLGTVTGTSANGILATDGGAGGLAIVTAAVTGGQRGINATNSGGGDLTITTHGLVTGGLFAVEATQTGGGALTLVNDGTLRNAALDSAAATVGLVADSDGASLRNLAAGTLLGQVTFTGQGDRLENAGLWRSAGGSSGFGAGADELVNQAGGLIQAAANATLGETTQLQGLESFRNAGTASLSDGGLGDRLVTSGDFIGLGGAVAFDVVLDDGTTPADLLVIGGATSGTTPVMLNVLGGSGAATLGNGTALIDVSATGDTVAGDFELAGGPRIAGIYLYDLVLEEDGIWYLQSQELGSLQGYANMLAAAQIQVGLMAGAMNERLGELETRAAPSAGQSAALGQADLARGLPGVDQDHGLSVWLKGVASQGDYAPMETASFEQSTAGFALGGDVRFDALLLDGDRLYLGLMAGYGDSQGEQANAVDFGLKGWSLGLYAGYRLDGLALDALLHGNRLEATLDSSLPVSHARTDLTAWGATLGASYALEVLPGLILEPGARLAYSSVTGEDLTDSLGVAVAFDEGESLRGHLGLTLRRHWTLHGLGDVAPYLRAEVIEEFLDGNRINANGVTFESGLQGTSYRVGFGLDAWIGRDVSIYGAADFTWGERVDQATQVTAGLRLSF